MAAVTSHAALTRSPRFSARKANEAAPARATAIHRRMEPMRFIHSSRREPARNWDVWSDWGIAFSSFISLVRAPAWARCRGCLLYTSDAADERSSVDLGGRRIIK